MKKFRELLRDQNDMARTGEDLQLLKSEINNLPNLYTIYINNRSLFHAQRSYEGHNTANFYGIGSFKDSRGRRSHVTELLLKALASSKFGISSRHLRMTLSS